MRTTFTASTGVQFKRELPQTARIPKLSSINLKAGELVFLGCLLAFDDKHVDRLTRLNEFESPFYLEGLQRDVAGGIDRADPTDTKALQALFHGG